MLNQPSVTCEAALLAALQNQMLVVSLLPQQTVQLSRTSLFYRSFAALSIGAYCDPRSIRNFAQVRAQLFAFLGLWLSVIRSRVQISDLAPLYRTVGAAISTECYAIPRRLCVRRDSIPSSTGRRGPPGPLHYGTSSILARINGCCLLDYWVYPLGCIAWQTYFNPYRVQMVPFNCPFAV